MFLSFLYRDLPAKSSQFGTCRPTIFQSRNKTPESSQGSCLCWISRWNFRVWEQLTFESTYEPIPELLELPPPPPRLITWLLVPVWWLRGHRWAPTWYRDAVQWEFCPRCRLIVATVGPSGGSTPPIEAGNGRWTSGICGRNGDSLWTTAPQLCWDDVVAIPPRDHRSQGILVRVEAENWPDMTGE